MPSALTSFRSGLIYSDVNKAQVKEKLDQNKIEPLTCVPELTIADIEETTHIVAQMGIEPIQKALKEQCEVILCGRCYDPAVFAALPVLRGFSKGLAYHLGKILECAAIAATPGSGSDCVLGILTEDSFICKKENIHGEIFFHIYGKNGIMGKMEPQKHPVSHELAILIEALGKTESEAATLCSITRSTLLHYGYENRISTAGNLAFPFSPSDINMGEMYEFSIYHLMPVENSDLFPVIIKEIGGEGVWV